MKRLLLGWALALLLHVPAFAADAATVARVVIEGNRRVDADAIRAALATKPGEPVDAARVDSDVKAVMNLGFFSDVTVEERGDAAHPELVFRVVEKPTVRDTSIHGNEQLSNDDLKDTVEVKRGAVLDLAAVKRSEKKISDKYIEKGYYLAEVTHRIDEGSDGQVSVVFEVNEHAKVQVRGIQFIGNTRVSRDELLAAMSTQEGSYLSFFTSVGNYREEVFQRDLQNLQFVYGDKGFVYAKIDKPSITISPDKRYLYITLHVDEGEQYRVGSIDFEGELLHEKDELRALTKVQRGDIFARSAVGRDIVALSDLYRDVGYAYANVNPETKVHPEDRTVDLVYVVDPGKKVYFERIEVTGNNKTREKIIRRELRIYEGELYSSTGLNTSKARVTALGFFDGVNITTERGSADDKMVARVTVKEKSTGTFQLGAGFSSYENFILTGQISQNNFMGWGQTLSLSVSYSSMRQLGQIQFVEPYFLDTKWTFAFDLYATQGTYQTFSRKAVGGSMTWGYELNGLAWWLPWTASLEDMRVFSTYTNEFVTVTPNGTDTTSLYDRYRSGTTSSIRLALQWDKRDNRLFPTKGFYEQVSAELAPPALAPTSVFGNSVNLFTRYALDVRGYYPLIWGVVARAKLGAGYITGWDDAHRVPISELYYLGGINSVRGYKMLSISPITRVAAGTAHDSDLYDFYGGGNKQVTLNLELEAPIVEKVGIRGVVFFDAGNAFAQGAWSDPTVSLSLYKSVGFGFRWFSPIGPLRFEWGFPLNRRFDQFSRTYIDSAVDFQFTIGNFF